MAIFRQVQMLQRFQNSFLVDCFYDIHRFFLLLKSRITLTKNRRQRYCIMLHLDLSMLHQIKLQNLATELHTPIGAQAESH